MEISPEQKTRIDNLCEQGLFLQALEAARPLGPLPGWQGARAMLLVARLAVRLGGARLSHWLAGRAWRLAPDNPAVRCRYAYALAATRGPYAAWRWMEETSEPEEAEPRAEWCGLRAQLTASLRDFDAAEKWLDRAESLAPTSAWLRVCRAFVLQEEDRYAEALAAARAAMELDPHLGAAIEASAHMLTLLDQDDEALKLLAEAAGRMECFDIAAQLYALRLELRQYEAAGDSLERCAALSPLGGKRMRRWLAAQRSEIAYRQGDAPTALLYAKQAGRGFFDIVATRMEDPARADAPSVLLPVGFVRQHHMTCAPATLSAIGRFWSKPAEHLEVVEEICYDGVSAYNERRWAEERGWATREFTVTEAAAKALLDRGVPFTLGTVDPGSAHLQAVIGYDARRGTLWIRDPSWRNARESIADKILKRNQAWGPRGMAMVPVHEQQRLDGLDLPDAALWDRLHAMAGALERHCRDEAAAICDELAAAGDGARLRWEARRRLACYDCNASERLAAVVELRRLFPEDRCLQLERLTCLRDLARRDERLAIYRELSATRRAHPFILQQYAQELRADARRCGEAEQLLRKAIRRAPGDAGSYYVLANVLWDRRQFAEAMDLYRFASCLNDKEEDFARSHFIAARWFKRTDEALGFLRGRFERFGKKSSYPGRTLVDAYMRCDRTGEALAALEEAMRLRPDDGSLQLFAANFLASCSTENLPRAATLLEEAKGASPPSQWLRTAARLADRQGRRNEALALWRELLMIQPLAADAHRAAAQALAETQGTAAALAHLREAADRFPHHQPLHRLWLQWVRDEPEEVREAVLRRAVAASPHDAWIRRELGFFLRDRRRTAEAWQEADVAAGLEAANPSQQFLRARLLCDEGKIDEAKEALREAIRLSVDYNPAVETLVELGSTAAERRESLALVRAELERQVTFGDGLLAFRRHAQGILEAEELLTVLHEAWQERPDLWHSWSAYVSQLLTMDRRAEAQEAARRATERFPLVPRLWLDLAGACRAAEDWTGQRAALEAANQINPDWGTAIEALADCLERQGEFEACRRLLEQAAARRPFEAACQGMLAEFLWRRQEREEALKRIGRALELDPGQQQAWRNLHAWAAHLNRRALAREAAEKIVASHGGRARSWLMLAEALDAPDELDQRLAALDKAVAIDPRRVETHEQRAIALVAAKRWDEALQACAPPPWGDQPPLALKARAAWVLAQKKELRKAIDQLRDVLAEEPGNFNGWKWLWLWRRDVKDFSGCLEAAEAMIRINPQYAISLGYLGESKRLNRDLAGARDAFRRSFELDPGYEYGGRGLFDLQLAAGDLDDAAKTLEALRRHNDNLPNRARGAQLDVRRNRKDEAVETLRRICATMTANDGSAPMLAASKALIDAGRRRAVLQVFEAALLAGQGGQHVGEHWAKQCAIQEEWRRCGRLLTKLAGKTPGAIEAAATFVGEAVKAKRQWQLSAFLWRNENWLRENGRTWAAVGFVVVRLAWHRRAARWLADWKQRPDVKPWMLLNVVEALRATNRDAEAGEAGRRALELPVDHTRAFHNLWLAADACRAGQIDRAGQLLQPWQAEKQNEYYQVLHSMVEGVVSMASAAEGDEKFVFRQAQKRFAQAVASGKLRGNPALRRFYRDAAALVAKHRGGLGAKIWRISTIFLGY